MPSNRTPAPASRSWGALALCLIAVALVAGLGARFSPAVDPAWYAALRKPGFNPPAWLFAPVWTTLYAMMAVSCWLAWRAAAGPVARYRVAALWTLQLALNAVWTPLFFGLQRVDLALADIVALDLAVVATIIAFQRVSRVAAWLLAPYLAWISFATALTAAIWRLNP
ncbi:MAG: tryptophan-rich sensory protein [Rhodospirillales bacterium]|nr:MAG: tryptophan-rich sensory protein [Rhodospirillales bacterium]